MGIRNIKGSEIEIVSPRRLSLDPLAVVKSKNEQKLVEVKVIDK